MAAGNDAQQQKQPPLSCLLSSLALAFVQCWLTRTNEGGGGESHHLGELTAAMEFLYTSPHTHDPHMWQAS